MVKIYKIQDVYKKDELEEPEGDKKWYDFIGGSKNLRCFLVDSCVVRSQIQTENLDLLDESLKPIYRNKDIFVAQDCSYAVPGFYVISSIKQVATINLASNEKICRMVFIAKNLREGLQELFNIQVAKLYCEEKTSKTSNTINKTSNLHFWILPIHNEYIASNPDVQRSNVKNYLEKFNFKENRENILKFNESMRKFINKIDLLKKDNELFDLLENFG